MLIFLHLLVFFYFKFSFWYSDQESAEEIIERNKEVRNILAARSKVLSFQYFQREDTERVNKIIQIFLKYDMMQNATNIIKMFLAFELYRKNSSAATEIIKLCIALNISLTNDENNKFLNLILGRQHSSTSPTISKDQQNKKKIDISPKYKFKF